MNARELLRSLSPASPGRAAAPVPWLESRAITLKAPTREFVDALSGPRASSGVSITEEGALQLDTVYACVSLIAGQIGSLPVDVYEGRGRQKRPLPGDSPEGWMLGQAPNPDTTSDVFFEALLAGVLLWGNGLAEKMHDRAGVARELYNCDPRLIEIERTPTGEKRFHVRGESGTFGTERFFHVPGFGIDGVKGLSVIGQARETLGTIRARQDYEGRFYSNDATPGGIVTVDGELTEDAARRLRAQIEAIHRGNESRHRIAILEAGTSWQSIGVPMKDLEFIARERFAVAQIARLFHVAPELVGGDRQGSLTYSTVEGQAIQFAVFTLRRWTTRLERALSVDPTIFPARRRYARFALDALMRGDSAARANFYRTMVEIGAYSVNDVRELEDREPIEGGDVYRTQIAGAAGDAGGAPAEPAAEPAVDEEARRYELAGSMALAAQRFALAARDRVVALEEARAAIGLDGPPPPPEDPPPAPPVAAPEEDPSQDPPDPPVIDEGLRRRAEAILSPTGHAGSTVNGTPREGS